MVLLIFFIIVFICFVAIASHLANALPRRWIVDIELIDKTNQITVSNIKWTEYIKTKSFVV